MRVFCLSLILIVAITLLSSFNMSQYQSVLWLVKPWLRVCLCYLDDSAWTRHRMRVASVNRLPDWPALELTSPCGPGHEDASNLERNLDCFGRRLSSQSGEVGFPGAGIVGDISKNCSSENYSSLASSSRKRTPYKKHQLKKKWNKIWPFRFNTFSWNSWCSDSWLLRVSNSRF